MVIDHEYENSTKHLVEYDDYTRTVPKISINKEE